MLFSPINFALSKKRTKLKGSKKFQKKVLFSMMNGISFL